MRNRLALGIAVVSFLVALAVGGLAESQYQRLVATTELIVPTVEIPPYTIVSRAMFKVRSFPAPMAQEGVYASLDEVAGKISTVTLRPEQLIYRDMLVRASQFRYSDDERLEIISFPIKPEQAVGGQVKVGQHINLYRLVLQPAPNQSVISSPDPKVWLAAPGAGIEVMQSDVLVVDVRSTQGSPIAQPPKIQANSGDAVLQSSDTNSSTTNRPLTILTVAVPPEVAKDILRLAGESQIASRYLLWVSLAPLTKSK